MREIEIKVLEVDREAMVKQLDAVGAKKIFEGILTTYNFKNLPEGVDTLRIRSENDKSFLTIKSGRTTGFAKGVDELSVGIDDASAAMQLLEKLGFEIKRQYRKRRISYRSDHARFDFDQYLDDESSIPELLEIEAEDEQALKEILRELNIPENKAVPWTGSGVLKHYSKN